MDDARETPAEPIIRMLTSRGAVCTVHDPHVTSFSHPLHTLEETTKGAHLLVLVTDHDDFRTLDPRLPGCLVRERKILDTRNLLDRKRWEEAGWTVWTLGRGSRS